MANYFEKDEKAKTKQRRKDTVEKEKLVRELFEAINSVARITKRLGCPIIYDENEKKSSASAVFVLKRLNEVNNQLDTYNQFVKDSNW